jgi:hypothetical protein
VDEVLGCKVSVVLDVDEGPVDGKMLKVWSTSNVQLSVQVQVNSALFEGVVTEAVS